MKFRKKPVIIDAIQFFESIKPWPDGVKGAEDYHAWIETLEGDMAVSEGDWIITGISGEKYPCKLDIFEKTYERVE